MGPTVPIRFTASEVSVYSLNGVTSTETPESINPDSEILRISSVGISSAKV